MWSPLSPSTVLKRLSTLLIVLLPAAPSLLTSLGNLLPAIIPVLLGHSLAGSCQPLFGRELPDVPKLDGLILGVADQISRITLEKKRKEDDWQRERESLWGLPFLQPCYGWRWCRLDDQPSDQQAAVCPPAASACPTPYTEHHRCQRRAAVRNCLQTPPRSRRPRGRQSEVKDTRGKKKKRFSKRSHMKGVKAGTMSAKGVGWGTKSGFLSFPFAPRLYEKCAPHIWLINNKSYITSYISHGQ